MTAERDERLRLRDMLRAADKILERTAGGRERFRADEMVQVWVVHHLEVIWATVERDIPRLRKQIAAILEGMSGTDAG